MYVPQQPPQSYYQRSIDLLAEKNLWGYGLDDSSIQVPLSSCNPGVTNNNLIFRCSVSAIPESPDLAKKCRLPLGLTLHPFRDQSNLHILQTSIIRCRYCRTYINPFAYLSGNRNWRCNLCYRTSDLPDDFFYNPDTRSYAEPPTRPEMQNTTIEYIATSDYMIRSPQPPCYLFVLDVSKAAIDSGYLPIFAEQLLLCLDKLPGGDRTLIGFLCVDSSVHYFHFAKNEELPRHMTVGDCEDPFVPAQSNLVVNLEKFHHQITRFLQMLPTMFVDNGEEHNCLGAALNIAFSMISEIGGRVTVMQARLPDTGLGALKVRESRSFGPATDFYKQLGLDGTSKQVSFDLFAMAKKDSVDIATLSEMCKVTGGTVYYFPNFHYLHNTPQVFRYEKHLQRYLTRKIGFEAVLRIRCSRGISLHSFYGNFFVRSTDLLALATVNPDSAIGVQFQIDEHLSGAQAACFQAALLYTSSQGDRRIRVHTIALPITNDRVSLYDKFDLRCSISLISKMAVEKAQMGEDLATCRDGIMNAVMEALQSYGQCVSQGASVLAPTYGQLKFFGLFALGMLKHKAFASTNTVSLDEQVSLMLLLKTAPIEVISLEICPMLYAVHRWSADGSLQRLPLTYGVINQDGIYIMDTGRYVYLYVRQAASSELIEGIFGVKNFTQIDEELTVNLLSNPYSGYLFSIIQHLHQSRAGYFAPVITIRDDSPKNVMFTSRLIEDRTEASHGYIEFLHHLRREMSK